MKEDDVNFEKVYKIEGCLVSFVNSAWMCSLCGKEFHLWDIMEKGQEIKQVIR